MEFLIGVDVGGSHVTCARVDKRSFSLQRESVTRRHLDTNGPVETVLDVFTDAIRSAIGRSWADLSGIGFAFPGPFDFENGICLITPGQNKFSQCYGVNVRESLKKRLPYDGSIGFLNDAACFAVGEYAAGAAQGVERALAITLGTGFGASFILNGKPVAQGPTVPSNGELWDVPYDGGIADDAFSTRGLVAAWKAASGECAPGVKEISQSAMGGDARAIRLFSEFGRKLGGFLNPWLEKFGVETLVIGGNIAKSWDLFVPALKNGIASRISVKRSVLGEDAQMVGAASAVEMGKE